MTSSIRESSSLPFYVGAILFDALTGRSLGEQADALVDHFDIVAAPLETAPLAAESGDLLITRAFAEGGVAEVADCSERPELLGARLGANQIMIRPRAGQLAGPGGDRPISAREEDDGLGESAPAFLAVADRVIAVADLGLSLFNTLKAHVLNGSFSVSSVPAQHFRPTSPPGLVTRTRKFRFKLIARYDSRFVSNPEFHFTVTLEYDGLNIRHVTVLADLGKSSSLPRSTFSIAFNPVEVPLSGEEPRIRYDISGTWNPSLGGGDSESFTGHFFVDAQGELKGLNIDAPGRRVWQAGVITREGGGRVPTRRLIGTGHNVFFDKPGSARMTDDALRALHGWSTGLPKWLRDQIVAGRVPLSLTGHASTTGSIERNMQIARARAAAVAAALKQLIGDSILTESRAPGELEAGTPDKVESPKERRCSIEATAEIYA